MNKAINKRLADLGVADPIIDENKPKEKKVKGMIINGDITDSNNRRIGSIERYKIENIDCPEDLVYMYSLTEVSRLEVRAIKKKGIKYRKLKDIPIYCNGFFIGNISEIKKHYNNVKCEYEIYFIIRRYFIKNTPTMEELIESVYNGSYIPGSHSFGGSSSSSSISSPSSSMSSTSSEESPGPSISSESSSSSSSSSSSLSSNSSSENIRASPVEPSDSLYSNLPNSQFTGAPHTGGYKQSKLDKFYWGLNTGAMKILRKICTPFIWFWDIFNQALEIGIRDM